MARGSHPFATIWSDEIRKLPNYLPHQPSPASGHPAQAGRIPADYQSPMHYGIEHLQKVKSLALIAAQYKMPKNLLAFQNVIFRFMPNSMFQQMGLGKTPFIQLSKSMMELDYSEE